MLPAPCSATRPHVKPVTVPEPIAPLARSVLVSQVAVSSPGVVGKSCVFSMICQSYRRNYRINRIQGEGMRALLAAVGTRGDVQPALALALELKKLGHAVRLCISPNFVDWATRLGLEAMPMGVEMRMPAKAGAMPTL